MSTWSQVTDIQNSIILSVEECLLSNFYRLLKYNFTKNVSEYGSVMANLLDIARVFLHEIKLFYGTIEVLSFNL